uniref:Putative ovule protein n=1 Tax=Solanum chacoense TaxID=4108 RepID=A0A0V0HVS2_SOLCH
MQKSKKTFFLMKRGISLESIKQMQNCIIDKRAHTEHKQKLFGPFTIFKLVLDSRQSQEIV